VIRAQGDRAGAGARDRLLRYFAVERRGESYELCYDRAADWILARVTGPK
jgi:hypothetical protein